MDELAASSGDRGTTVAPPFAGRVGADKFRALTARLKNPHAPHSAASAPPALAAVYVAPVPVAETAPVLPPEPEAPVLEVLPPPVPSLPEIRVADVVEQAAPAAFAEPPVHTPELEILEIAAVVPDVEPEAVVEAKAEPKPELEPAPAAKASPASLDEVKARLNEDALLRQQRLDIENVWRQALAKPTLEERALYLQEAAAIAAAENPSSTETLQPVAPEFDLSRIEPAALSADAAASPSVVAGPHDPASRTSAYADDRASLANAELARSLLDMMASGAASGLPQERALAADTLLRLLPKLAQKPLGMLAERLAKMDNPPHLLVAKLIRDPRVEVSGPLLENCMHITDQDLSMVVAEENQGKRRMLARRRKLSRAIGDELIATRDPAVLLTLVRNAGAEISHDGFKALIELAGSMPDILAPISTRADLSPPFAFELFWAAPTQLRRYILSRFLTDSETLTKILKITLATQGETEAKEQVFPDAGKIVGAFDLACRGKLDPAAELLAGELKIDAAAVQRILCDREGEPIVILLKAAGFPRSHVMDLLNGLKNSDLPLLDQDRAVEDLQSMFDTLSFNKARILLTYWDWAARKAGPYAPVH